MTPRKSIFVSLLLAASAVAACGQSVEERIYIAKNDVIEGMRLQGVNVVPAQVSLLADIPVRSQHPALELVKIEPLTSHSSRVLMRCVDRSLCIPFYAVVNGLTTDRSFAELPKPPETAPTKAASVPIVIKRGSLATLQIVGPEMLITIPVVCLQNGHQGEHIRVASTDQKNTYVAEIVSPGLLRSHL